MPQPAVVLPGVFDHITEFANIADPSRTWRNTVTYRSTTTPSPNDPIGDAIGGLMVAMCHPDAQIIKFSVFNWARGRQPYPMGQPIYTITGAVPGNAEGLWPYTGTYVPVGGEVALRVDHEPFSGGRPGRWFFRALMGVQDIISESGGKWRFSGNNQFTDVKFQALLLSSSFQSHLLGANPSDHMVVVRYSPKTGVVHGSVDIQQLLIVGPTTNKQTRKSRR